MSKKKMKFFENLIIERNQITNQMDALYKEFDVLILNVRHLTGEKESSYLNELVDSLEGLFRDIMKKNIKFDRDVKKLKKDSFKLGKKQALNLIISLTERLNKEELVKVGFNTRKELIDKININPLTEYENLLMEVLWSIDGSVTVSALSKQLETHQYGWDKYVIKHYLKKLQRKKYIQKKISLSWSRKILRIEYNILTTKILHEMGIDNTINVLCNNADIMYVSLTDGLLTDKQIKKIRGICNGEDLD